MLLHAEGSSLGNWKWPEKQNGDIIKRLAQIIRKRISHKGEAEKINDEALAKVYPKKTNNYMEKLKGQVNTLSKKIKSVEADKAVKCKRVVKH